MKKPNLIFISDDRPGYTRRKWGRGFSYFNHTGERISDKKLVKRCKDLVIPPMWSDVWICQNENGYLQATGRDLKNRKQYIYHNAYVAWRQWSKFSKMITFAENLPLIRRETDEDLERKKWSKKRVAALVVKILDEVAVRMGNPTYTKRNKTYGLTTLRRRHMDINGDELLLSYTGKSSKEREVCIEDQELIELIKECSELPGYQLFRYRENGSMHNIESADINTYLQEITKEELTGKDFRTWTGTALAVELFPEAKKIAETHLRKKLEPTLVGLVSKKLGNTLAVCREYYIHPTILDKVKKGEIPALSSVRESERKQFNYYLDDAEILAYRLIKN